MFQDDIMSLYRTDVAESKNNKPCDLCVCVRAVSGELGQISTNRRHDVEVTLGTNAILFCLPPGVSNDPNSVSIKFKVQNYMEHCTCMSVYFCMV